MNDGPIIADSYSLQRNVLEIKKYLDKLEMDLSKLEMYKNEDWKKKLYIVRETEKCVDLMRKIFDTRDDREPLRYGEWHGVHCWTFSIGQYICKIVCRLCVHVIVNFSSSPIELRASLSKIPYTLNKWMDSFKRIINDLLSKEGFHKQFMADRIEYNSCRIYLEK